MFKADHRIPNTDTYNNMTSKVAIHKEKWRREEADLGRDKVRGWSRQRQWRARHLGGRHCRFHLNL